MQKISIPEKPPIRVYWPENLKDDGYGGQLEIRQGVCSLVIPKSGAKSKDIAKDLELASREFKAYPQCFLAEVRKSVRTARTMMLIRLLQR